MATPKKIIVLIAVLGFLALRVAAQGTLPTDPDNSVPLDGGLTLAIAAGVGYGTKRLMKKRTVSDK